jgi:hypothetical protein
MYKFFVGLLALYISIAALEKIKHLFLRSKPFNLEIFFY